MSAVIIDYETNQWDALGEDEKIEWALKCADQFRGAAKMMQAARQALDALEAAVSDDRPYLRKSKSAIAALREAIIAALGMESNAKDRNFYEKTKKII